MKRNCIRSFQRPELQRQCCRLTLCTTRNLNVIPNQARFATTTTTTKRYFSKGWTGARGYDITNDVYEYNKKQDGTMNLPKINISGYDDHGFVVKNMVQQISPTTEKDSDGSVYIYGSSMIVLPYGCFLWNNVHRPEDVTVESLSFLLLLRPKIEYLFIGCQNSGYGSIAQLNNIQNAFRNHPATNSTIVVEQMQLYNAIGTFNLLNAEDRQVAAAFILDSSSESLSSSSS